MYVLQYLLKVSIALGALYTFYLLALRPLTFYRWNRFYLLFYSMVSFIIPFINITPWIIRERVETNQLVNIIPLVNNYPAFERGTATRAILQQPPSIYQWLLLIFLIGSVLLLARFVYNYLSLRRVRRTAVLLSNHGGLRLYQVAQPVSPFSFGKAVYFNSKLHNEEELRRIILHELVHVRQQHSVDLITAEMLCIVNWFNPFAWLVRHAIRQNLEFIADNEVIANGLNKKEYQYLLLKVVGIPQYSIAGNFNLSSLKKRITMMNKRKSTQLHITRFVFVLPLLVVLFLAFRKSETVSQASKSMQQPIVDTFPAPPPPPAAGLQKVLSPAATQSSNKKGFIISVADNNGECVVLVKDAQQKIIQAITLIDWNKNKKENESKYGTLPPSLPPPPLMAVQAPLQQTAPPAAPQLPEKVSGISTHRDINTKTGAHVNTATVTLNDGTKEQYNLNNAQERDRYLKNYGVLPVSPPLPLVSPLPPVAPLNAVPPVNITADTVIIEGLSLMPKPNNAYYNAVPLHGMAGTPLALPMIIVDGKIKPDGFDVHTIDAGSITSITVLKDKNACAQFGERGRNGVIDIKTRNGKQLARGLKYTIAVDKATEL